MSHPEASDQSDTKTAAADAASVTMLTVREAAQQAKISRYIIYNWIEAGLLPTQRVSRQHRVTPADLAAAQAVAHLGHVLPAWRRNPRRVGARLRAMREAAGLSQLELAAASGLQHETISRFELGRQAAQAESVHKLAQALGVAPTQFVARGKIATVGMTVNEAAARLGVPTDRVEQWLLTGTLAGVKVSGQWRVPVAEVVALDGSERLRGRSRRLDPRYKDSGSSRTARSTAGCVEAYTVATS